MQWDASERAGFSEAKPWLPLAADFATENVASLDTDPGSILSLYRILIALRRSRRELAAGDYEPLFAEGDLLLYRRMAQGRALTIALNLGADPISVTASPSLLSREILLSTFLDRKGERVKGSLDLRGNEGVIIEGSDQSPQGGLAHRA
jgi:alpha-glucosidase